MNGSLSPVFNPTPDSHSDRNWMPWIVALCVIAAAIVAVLLLSHSSARSTPQAPNPYAAQLAISNVHVSQASNFAGDQLTYVEGTIANHGNKTVTGIAARVLFATLDGDPPQAALVPFNLVRTTQPYVDTAPVSAAPLEPGTSRDFRLIFDSVPSSWNQQPPQIQLENIQTR